jgi:hypothetical protein
LRDYQAGDPMPRIAWKAVARGAGWYTKQFEGSGGGGPVELAYHALPAEPRCGRRVCRGSPRGYWSPSARRGRSRSRCPTRALPPDRAAIIGVPR